MINRIIEFSLKQRLLVVAMVILIAALGFYSLNNIPIDAFPDVTNIQVQILAEAPGLSPVEVEKLVTFPIEVAMNGLPRLTQVRSISKFGLTVVTVVFEDGVDVYFARQLVFERLQRVKQSMPPNVPDPEMGPITTGMGEIYQYFLESDSFDIMGLRTIQDWIIKPQLRTVPGVTEVNSFGGLVKQYQVLVEPTKLLSYNLTLEDIFEAVEKNSSVAGGNFLEHASEQYIIRGIGLAMGVAGTDAAIETANIVLMSNYFSKVSDTIKLSKRTLKIIKQNITIALVTKAVFLLLGSLGFASLWMAILADDGTALIVIINGLRLLNQK